MATQQSVSDISLSIDSYVFERVPDYRRAVLAGFKSEPADAETIGAGLAQANRRWAQSDEEVVEVPAVQRWRKAYRRVGLNPTRTRPAVEALIRRARAGGVASFDDACVDVGAIITLLHSVPVGMHTVDGLEGELTLAPASGRETFTTFAGEVEHPDAREIVWSCGETILTRHWVHKQGIAGSVCRDSARFAVNLDFLGEDPHEDVIEAAVQWLGQAGVSIAAVAILDSQHRSGEVSYTG